MIAFKQQVSINEWTNIHPALKRILCDLDDNQFLPLMVITRIYNPQVVGETGVHRTKPHRAADIRSNDIPAERGEDIVGWLNDRWKYEENDKHQVALQHPKTGSNRHIHIQVRPGTETRKRRMS